MTFTWLRARMKSILIGTIILIIPAFVFWGTGAGAIDPNTVAMRINAHDVSIREYQEAVRSARRFVGEDFAEAYAVQELRDRYIVRDAADELGITVSDQAITKALRADPFFQNEDGSFNAESWNKVVSTENGKRAMERSIPAIRDSLLLNALREMVTSAVVVSENEVQQQFEHDYARRRIAYVEFQPSELVDQVEIAEEELAAYFEANGVQYTTPEQVRLRIVQIPKEPSESDLAEIQVMMYELEARARSGEDFSALAVDYSQGPNASKGGDLGWIRRSDLIDELQVVFDVGPGEVTPPIHTTFGWHLLKLEALRGDGSEQEGRVYRIQMPEEPSEQTYTELYEKMDELERLAKTAGLADAAAQLGLEVIEPDVTTTGATELSGVQDSRDVLAAITELAAGELTERLDGWSALTIAEVVERVEAQVPAMDTVRARVESDFRLRRAGDIASSRATELAEAAKAAASLAAVAPTSPTETEPFTRVGSITSLGRPGDLFNQVFAMEAGTIGDPVSYGPRWIVFEVLDAMEADPTLFDFEGSTIRTATLNQRQRQAWTDYLERLRAEALYTPNLAVISTPDDVSVDSTSTTS